MLACAGEGGQEETNPPAGRITHSVASPFSLKVEFSSLCLDTKQALVLVSLKLTLEVAL